VRLIDGRSFQGDTLLWGTGYDLDLGFLDAECLSGLTHLEDLERRCGSLFLSRDAPNLFFSCASGTGNQRLYALGVRPRVQVNCVTCPRS